MLTKILATFYFLFSMFYFIVFFNKMCNTIECDYSRGYEISIALIILSVINIIVFFIYIIRLIKKNNNKLLNLGIVSITVPYYLTLYFIDYFFQKYWMNTNYESIILKISEFLGFVLPTFVLGCLFLLIAINKAKIASPKTINDINKGI
jgi:hypothetical protein